MIPSLREKQKSNHSPVPNPSASSLTRLSFQLSSNGSGLIQWQQKGKSFLVPVCAHDGHHLVCEADCLAGIPAPLLSSCGTCRSLIHSLCLSFRFCQKGVTAAVFTTFKRRKQPERPSVDAWRSRMWCPDTAEYYLPLKGRKF